MLVRWNRALILSPLALRSQAWSSNYFSHRRSLSLAMTTSKTVLVPIADGSEEIETTCITDTLTRFGADVTVASVGPSLECRMSRGIKVVADCPIADCATKNWDLIALPGGMPGAEHLRDSDVLVDLIKKQKAAGKLYAAICASPAVALATHGLIDPGSSSTCYPAPKFHEMLPGKAHEDAVVVSGNLVTSQGPATALRFALQLGQELYGVEKRNQIAKEMLHDD